MPKNKRQWFEIKNEGSRPAVYIYGDIGSSYWDDDAVSASEFIEAIKPYANQPLDIHINSGGGDVFDGISMYTAIKARIPETVCYVDALAASAATLPAMASDKVVMAVGSLMMIHRASTFAWGNADDIQATIDLLLKIDGQLADIYSRRTGEDVEEITSLLASTHWMTHDEAVEEGFADEVDGEVLKAAACVSAPILAQEQYKKAPESLKELLASTESDTDEIIPTDEELEEPTATPEPKAPGADGAETSEVEAEAKPAFTVFHSGIIYNQKNEGE